MPWLRSLLQRPHMYTVLWHTLSRAPVTVGPSVLELEMTTSFCKLLIISGLHSAQFRHNSTVWMRIPSHSILVSPTCLRTLGPPPPPTTCRDSCPSSSWLGILLSGFVRTKGSATLSWRVPFWTALLCKCEGSIHWGLGLLSWLPLFASSLLSSRDPGDFSWFPRLIWALLLSLPISY